MTGATGAPIPGVSASPYADGIPAEIGGQPVLRPNDVLRRGPLASDVAGFLVGGWTHGIVLMPCPTVGLYALLDARCSTQTSLGERPGDNGLLGRLLNVRGVALPASGAIVVRVHGDDALAASCPSDAGAYCKDFLVIDVLVWTAADGIVAPVPAPQSVSEFLAARAAGTLNGGPITLRGYWSYRVVGHSCAVPLEPTGILEIYCHDHEWGITERDEPIFTERREGGGYRAIPASGPNITPYIPEDLQLRLIATSGLSATGLWPLPVPIVVVGHVNDSRAELCRVSARQLCRDRFVMDRILEFDPSSVATPSPSPPPTPFPSPAPAALFSTTQCHGDVPYSFAGWTTEDMLGIGRTGIAHVFAMVTRDAVPLGDWIPDPERAGHRYRVWGRGVCWTEFAGVIQFDSVAGTRFRLSDDGKRVR